MSQPEKISNLVYGSSDAPLLPDIIYIDAGGWFFEGISSSMAMIKLNEITAMYSLLRTGFEIVHQSMFCRSFQDAFL
ncbi:hypothetical protein [Vibrio campbellii]|uniref:hypothetical protein n=1 Tax=Vibrio campbellii TaxID=680 RepID=UPI001E293F00|nr:hypothetical protein [Vibrio campbellii]